MRRIVVLLGVAILWTSSSWAGEAGAVPQTARQALTEMFFGKTPGTFVKHLPMATRTELDKAGILASLQQYSALASQLQSPGQNVKTFDSGPLLLMGEDPRTGQKVEITVENEAVRGDRDDIQLSFRVYKGGEVQPTPFMPRVTFSMKREAEIWTLNEISVTIHLPLADPAFLKAITEKMKPQPVTASTLSARSDSTAQPAGSDAMVIGAMRTILTAEVTYFSSFPAVGYTCSLSDLDGFGGGTPNEHQAMLINSGLASGKRYGFVFTLSGCAGTPAAAFHLTAAPSGNASGRKAFCADQSGVIRFSNDGNPATCLASGEAIQ